MPFLRSVPAGRTAIDVGAHIGGVSHLLAPRHDLVVALEPNVRAVRRLMWLDLPNLVVLTAAAGRQPGVQDLHLPIRHNRSIAALGTLVETALPPGAADVERTAVVSLDTLGLLDVDFLKVDVEGFEQEVLEGAVDVLTRDRPAILVESEQRHRLGAPAAVGSLLGSIGYEGLFVYDGEVERFEDFRADVHQAVPPGLSGAIDERYVSNFVFVQASEIPTWRDRLAAACRSTTR